MEILDNNNLDLQKLMQEIQALPQAKSWGGGSTDIVATELSQDLVIPAYTDTELTVKKMEKGVTGIDFGTVTVDGSNYTSAITIEHNLAKVPSYAMIVNKDITLDNLSSNRVGMAQAVFNYNFVMACSEINFSTSKYVLETFYRTGSLSKTETTVTFKPKKWELGTYYWFAIA